MSQAAYVANCERCQGLRELMKGKVAFDERPCPQVGRKQIHPTRVWAAMRGDWVCEKRVRG